MYAANIAPMLQEDRNYKAFVGPARQYDLRGAMQFSMLCAMGLREDHRLLDIGCGSLRGGRLLISYLAAGGYTGLEPNRWLVEEGIDRHLGRDALALKEPTFLYNETFDVSDLEPFDFVVAQSIASHTGPEMTQALIGAARQALAPSGLAMIDFVHHHRDGIMVDRDRGVPCEEGWIYPDCVGYRPGTIARWLKEAGLHGVPLAWYHPRQTWWVMAHEGTPLPPRQLRRQARGAILPWPESWSPRRRLRNRLLKAVRRNRARLRR